MTSPSASAPDDPVETAPGSAAQDLDSAYAWLRLLISLLIMTIGNAGMWVIPVVLPVVQAEFLIGRADAALPYTLMMVGFGLGGVLMGRLSDRFGLFRPLLGASLAIGAGFVLAAQTHTILGFALAHGVLIGLVGCAVTFAPLMADTALWFARRRGIAVAVCASGNYLAGAVWPPVMQHFIATEGWRTTYMGIGLFCACSMGLLALLMRQAPPSAEAASGPSSVDSQRDRPFDLPPNIATAALCVAGLSCCVAMAMPQVHIVAYCTDLGFGAAQGAQMLSIMLACGIISRLVSGALSDRIGGIRTLVLGSALQCSALLLFLPFDGLVPLYIVSAMFGLFQGGIVPSYTLVVRENFSPTQIGVRVGTVIMFTMLGMALGGWMSGKVFDLTGSYHAAFLNGIGWNLLNLVIAVTLLRRLRRKQLGSDPD
jgi:MFS family permease